DLVLVALRADQERHAEERVAVADRIALARAELVGIGAALIKTRPRGRGLWRRRLGERGLVACAPGPTRDKCDRQRGDTNVSGRHRYHRPTSAARVYADTFEIERPAAERPVGGRSAQFLGAG